MRSNLHRGLYFGEKLLLKGGLHIYLLVIYYIHLSLQLKIFIYLFFYFFWFLIETRMSKDDVYSRSQLKQPMLPSSGEL